MSKIKNFCEVVKLDKFTFIDIGSRAGIPTRWKPLEEKLKIIGFEPDLVECNKLNEEYLNYKSDAIFYPTALLESNKRAHIFNCNDPAVDSFYEPNSKLWARFAGGEIYKVKKKTEIVVTTLDEVFKKNNHSQADFIKIDVQGSELAVIQGAKKSLSSCFGVEVEVEFTSLYNHQPLFSDIDSELRDNGFTFFEFRDGQLHHEKRYLTNFPGMKGTGQLIASNAVYFKDYINNDTIPNNPGASLICCLAYQKYDYAIELLHYYHEKGIYDKNITNKIENLIQKFGTSKLIYLSDNLKSFFYLAGKTLVPKKYKSKVLKILNKMRLFPNRHKYGKILK